MKKFLAILLAVMMTLTLVACGPKEPEQPAEPKILTHLTGGHATNAHGVVAQQSSDVELQEYISACLYGCLPIDGEVVWAPILAASDPVDVNGDGLVWEIAISPDAKWENGEQITADTFMYSFKMGLDPKLVFAKAGNIANNFVEVVNANAYYTQGSTGTAVAWEDVGFKKIDDMTIQVTLVSKSNADLVMRHFATRATSPLYQPIFEQCLSADGATSTYGSAQDKILACGPFKMTKWEIGSVREFAKNEYFPRADLVKLDGIITYEVEDGGTQLQMFENGEIDFLHLTTAAGVDQYVEDPRLVNVPSAKVFNLEFNTNNTNLPILNNENFRKALYYGINRTELAKLTQLIPATGVVGRRSTALPDGTKFRTLADQAGYLPAGDGYDPELAKQYYDKALAEEKLTSLEITLLSNASVETQQKIAEYLQESLQNLFGADKFTLKINALPSAQNSPARKSWKDGPEGYEFCITGWELKAGDWDPLNALFCFTEDHGNRNAPNDKYPELNALYREGGKDENRLNQDKRNQLAMEMEKYIVEHAVAVPMLYGESFSIISENVILPMDEWHTDIKFGFQFCDLSD